MPTCQYSFTCHRFHLNESTNSYSLLTTYVTINVTKPLMLCVSQKRSIYIAFLNVGKEYIICVTCVNVHRDLKRALNTLIYIKSYSL